MWRLSVWWMGVVMATTLAAGAHAVGEPGCLTLPRELPPVPPLQARTSAEAFTYDKWDDYCYGGAAVSWTEWNEGTDWDAGSQTLTRKIDIYRRTDIPLSDSIPLVLYAHPNGASEEIPVDSALYDALLMKVLAAGMAFASLESRHPLSSFVVKRPAGLDKPEWPEPTKVPVPSNDIATAVRWLKFNRRIFGIDPNQIVLVGQSRGSAALLNALLNEPAQPQYNDWRSKSSSVRGVYVVQAQTSYLESEVGPVFVQANGPNGEPYRYWYHQDAPDVIIDVARNIPGSAVQLARLKPLDDLVPVHMAYEQRPTLQADGRTVQPQCYESQNRNRAYQQFDNDNNPNTPPIYDVDKLPTCPVDGQGARPVFDVHDPNYGQYFAQAYADRGVPQRITRCVDVGRDNVEGLYADLMPFVHSVLDQRNFVTSCEGGGVPAPTPPASMPAP
ncbi:hypothetical protein AACH06_19875 [Ideonella sp. DXS29W]|uniref:Alpha/beta hydrolase n=1 Tax=Ideonella lacteola TaxID=2984193 RepID=A0ABU9BVC0_9BURK